jgi:hypothetical protein
LGVESRKVILESFEQDSIVRLKRAIDDRQLTTKNVDFVTLLDYKAFTNDTDNVDDSNVVVDSKRLSEMFSKLQSEASTGVGFHKNLLLNSSNF